MTTLSLVDDLVADMEPVRRVRAVQGAAILLVACLTVCAWTIGSYGMRADLVAFAPHPLAVLRSGMLLILGAATAHAVIRAARPAVGHAYDGWWWALAAAMLFPLAALATTVWSGDIAARALSPEVGKTCLRVGATGALAIAVVFTLWLRRGAVTAPERAGWLTGIASGSFGTFAFSLHCPVTNLVYTGVWYALTVALAAVVGRLVVPRFIRW